MLEGDFQKITTSENVPGALMLVGNFPREWLFKLLNFWHFGEFSLGERVLSDALILEKVKLGVDDVREVKSFFNNTPSIARKKIAVIFQAEKLTAEAQNALLKIAEEPHPQALLILVVSNLDLMLPTLRSRFLKLFHQENILAKEKLPIAVDFFRSNLVKREALIKELFLKADDDDDKNLIFKFLEDLMALYVEAGVEKNYKALEGLFELNSKLNRFNVNKKLSLKVWSQSHSGY